MSTDGGWQRWVRNGRLATIVWLMVFTAWLALKFLNIPLEGLDIVFVSMSGAWVANLGITVHRPGAAAREARAADKTGDTDGG